MSSRMSAVNSGKIMPGDLPTPPRVAIQVVKACSDPNISSQQLAKVLNGDTAFVAELLRMVNSPFYGLGRTVTSASQAVVVLGQAALRNLALWFCVRETLRTSPVPGIDIQKYWEDVLRRAVSARGIAELVGIDGEEAFTVGMLQDIGFLSMFLIFPQHTQVWARMRVADPLQRYGMEQEIFDATHDQVAELLVKSWSLPEQLVIPIASHHWDFLENLPAFAHSMTRVAACADWIAAVHTSPDCRLTLARARKMVGECFALDSSKIDELIAEVPGEVVRAAAALGLDVDKQAPMEQLLRESNRRLISQSQDDPERIVRLEQALEDRERLVEELQRAYDCLAQLAYFDPLTALVNRRRLEESFLGEIARHSRSSQPLSLVILDLDGFKRLNDEHGHDFGDLVLQSVAEILTGTLRCSDIAARIGGEEMCLLLPETDAKGGGIAAERVRRAIEALHFPKLGDQLSVTSSFGGATWVGDINGLGSTKTVMKDLMNVADKALYQSKKSGRNQINWGLLN